MCREAAASYRQKGYAIVFIRPGEKRPMRRGWTLKSEEPSDYTEGSQLSILTGALSNHHVVVDVDSDEARRLAPSFLPPTGMKDGRPSKPAGHWHYKIKGTIPPELTAKTDVAGGIGGMRTRHFTGAGIDLLGTGSQCIVPPSKHPSGEYRTFEDPNGEPAEVDAVELTNAVEALAKACGWVDGRREARAYIKPIRAVDGAGGDVTTFKVANILVNGFNVGIDDARDILREWNRTNAEPPWNPEDLERKLQSAAAKIGSDPRYPPGYLIREGRAPNDPIRLAFLFPGRWVNWNNIFYRYEDGKYVSYTKEEMNAKVWRHIDRVYSSDYDRAMRKWDHSETREEGKRPKRRAVKKGEVASVLEALRARFIIPSSHEMPCLLSSGERKNYISFRNGILDLNTFELLPHSPDWFSTARLDYDYNPDAVEDRLSAWLRDWFGDDTEAAKLAQEWCGYLLTRCTDEHAFMVMVGDGSNGKGGFSAMVQAQLGPENVSHQTWKGLSERFGTMPTLGKLLNASDEVGQYDRAAEHVIKWFVGGQPMLFEPKGLPTFTATPMARLMVACNSFPHVADKTDGVWRRMLLLQFKRKITEGNRVKGMDKPEWWTSNANMPGVVNWALAGLKRLREQGRFTRPRSSEEGKADLRRESNPVTLFFEEYVMPGGWVPAGELYQRYREWAPGNGFQPISVVSFGREVGRFYPDAKTATMRAGKKVVRIWNGIQWRVEEPETISWPEIPEYLRSACSSVAISTSAYDPAEDWSEEDELANAMCA